MANQEEGGKWQKVFSISSLTDCEEHVHIYIHMHLEITRKSTLFPPLNVRFSCSEILLHSDHHLHMFHEHWLFLLNFLSLVCQNPSFWKVNIDFIQTSDSKRPFMVHRLVPLNFWFTGRDGGPVVVKINHQRFSVWTSEFQSDWEAPLLRIICSWTPQFRWCAKRIMTVFGCLLYGWFTAF